MSSTSHFDTHYDVVIVGGRPAGASLAARLGQQKIKTLIVERASFPSGPAVSSPFILAHTMELLDEIGADESEYARNTPKMHRFVLEFKDYFRVFFKVAEKNGRDYMYTVDRVRFDTALWENLKRFDSVTAVDNFSVTGLVQNHDGCVVGIRGRHPKQPEVTIHADLVVGADGRYSTVANEAGAAVTERRTDVDTTLYYGMWQDVADYDEQGDPLPHIHTSVDGFSYVFMPTADGLTSVIVQAQSDLYDPKAGAIDEAYLEKLQAQPYVWRRLRNARRVTPLSGIKRIGNLFRQAAGEGWALVGDAYHQKDSLDAQGIYDALLGAKILAEEISAWRNGEKSWEKAAADYDGRVYAELKPMFDSTMSRVKREIYDIPPPFVAKNILRWVISSQGYQSNFSQQLIRQIEPNHWTAPAGMAKMLLSGLTADVVRKLKGRPDPFAMPPVNQLP